MADVTSTRKDMKPQFGAVCVMLDTGASPTFTGGTDTLTMTLADYGIRNVLAVKGYVHTTDASVVVAESGTTAVSGGVLTYTSAAGNDSCRRIVIVYGES